MEAALLLSFKAMVFTDVFLFGLVSSPFIVMSLSGKTWQREGI